MRSTSWCVRTKESSQYDFLVKSAVTSHCQHRCQRLRRRFSLLISFLTIYDQVTDFARPRPRSSRNETESVMTSSASSTPDIASLSLSSKPSQQRIHDSYDYEGNGGNGGARSQYHYSTSPPIPAQSQYNPLTLNQSPLKNKTMRGGLPSVCFFPPPCHFQSLD